MAHLLANLSPRGRQLVHILKALAAQGYSANRALEILRSQGLGYRRQDFLRDWAIITGHGIKADRLKHVPKEKRVSLELHSPTAWLRPQEYAYVVYVTVDCQPCTDFYLSQCVGVWRKYATLKSSQRLSPKEACRYYQDLFLKPSQCRDVYSCYCEAIDCQIMEAYRGIEPWER